MQRKHIEVEKRKKGKKILYFRTSKFVKIQHTKTFMYKKKQQARKEWERTKKKKSKEEKENKMKTQSSGDSFSRENKFYFSI